MTYYDENSAQRQEASTTAPWIHPPIINESTYPLIGLGAQTEGTEVTCRITVDGGPPYVQVARGKYASVFCAVNAF
ncbi:MmpS family transport accessory protein [Nocardia noduli]|uniref:MmpS family transport accessory protein n=1 Tax=Nocardia noduli TaxID=2815722 RepID=UPI001C23542C|nr:MmpS family transport accessory protein [Nocardia noduli]